MNDAKRSEAFLDWRDVPPGELEAHFNPRVAVADAADRLAERAALSAKVRERIAGQYDLRYGAAPKQTFDLHLPMKGRPPFPALIFVHGGYWRALDKSDHSFVAPAFLDAGYAFVNLNFDLCPTVTLSELTRQVLEGIAHVWREAAALGLDRTRVAAMGHSAGAHSIAMALAEDWKARGLQSCPFQHAICVSGIYQAEVVRHISINQEVQLTPDLAAENDALTRPPRGEAKVLVTVGGEEPKGWIGQSVAYHRMCQRAGADSRLEIVPGTNHFTVLSHAAEPGRPEYKMLMEFLP